MKASIQYDDYIGTAAADISDHFSLEEHAQNLGLDTDKYEVIGVDFYAGYSDFFSYSFICVDKQIPERKAIRVHIRKRVTREEFFELFKRFNVTITWNKGGDLYADYPLEESDIYIGQE